MNLIKTTETGLLKFNTLDAVAGNFLAAKLEIDHPKMMRTIKRVMKDEKKRKSHPPHVDSENLNFHAVFKESEYKNKRGRTYKTYIMNEDAAYLVIANSQSAKAHELKVWFKSEFNKMKQERVIRDITISDSRSYTDALKVLRGRLVEAGTTQPEGGFYSTIQRKIHKKATGRSMPKGGIDHCIFTKEEEVIISVLRRLVPTWIEEYKTLTPKETRKALYARIESFTVEEVRITDEGMFIDCESA